MNSNSPHLDAPFPNEAIKRMEPLNRDKEIALDLAKTVAYLQECCKVYAEDIKRLENQLHSLRKKAYFECRACGETCTYDELDSKGSCARCVAEIEEHF